MWKERVLSVNSECTFGAPASEEALKEVEEALDISPPEDLWSLWAECNGITDQYGDGIYPIEQAIRENLELRSYPEQNDLHMSFDSLFVFAGAGNGDLFFYPIQANGSINWDFVYLWNHEDDSRTWAAHDLEQFVQQWYSGALTP